VTDYLVKSKSETVQYDVWCLPHFTGNLRNAIPDNYTNTIIVTHIKHSIIDNYAICLGINRGVLTLQDMKRHKH